MASSGRQDHQPVGLPSTFRPFDPASTSCRRRPNWMKPDDGIWEVRGGQQQFIYSKVQC
jgi:hypothetical protein